MSKKLKVAIKAKSAGKKAPSKPVVKTSGKELASLLKIATAYAQSKGYGFIAIAKFADGSTEAGAGTSAPNAKKYALGGQDGKIVYENKL